MFRQTNIDYRYLNYMCSLKMTHSHFAEAPTPFFPCSGQGVCVPAAQVERVWLLGNRFGCVKTGV